MKFAGDPSTLEPAGAHIDPLAGISSSTRNRDRNLPLGESIRVNPPPGLIV